MDEERLLSMERNPVALAVLVAAQMLKAGKNEVKRFEYSKKYLRLMKTRGYTLQERGKLVCFIEEIANLSMEKLIEEIGRDIADLIEEGNNMYIPPITKKVLEEKFVASQKAKAIAEGLEQGREEGREEGREQGREEGREEGREQGREEGREKGREERTIEFALKLLARKMSVIDIADLTGLGMEDILLLQK